MTTKTTKSRKVNPSQQAPADARTLTRAEVAKALGCSVASVRRMEGTTLHPTQDAEGIHRFDPLEVIHLLRDRSAAAVDPSREGERDARVFDLLDAGKGVREIVTTLRLPIAVVLKLSDQWKEAGRRDLIVPPACRAELERCLGSAKDAAELTQLVRSLAVERERLDTDNEKTRNRINSVVSVVGEIAARSPDLARSFPALKMELDSEQIELLDRVFNFFQHARSASAVPSDAAEVGAVSSTTNR